ncbi:MAG: ribosome biogenesis GTPase Der [Candidatus Marinimicrobia bacterium]|nr:ribosome biogenesis GTPase Der [Candidatus Neomarinimicrobiota bacterium]
MNIERGTYQPVPGAASRAIALVGRPNVGKSALFNRVLGRRLAIVHEESGVTRDRLICAADWGPARFQLIDTGGIGLLDGEKPADGLEAATRRQVDVALEEAAVIVLVVDLQAGLTPLDQVVADILRTADRPVFIAANKADNDSLAAQAVEFSGLGFPVFPLSALHGLGVEDLLDRAVAALPPGDLVETINPWRVAVVGRPNAGKSSLINRWLGQERTVVSAVPGTTRDCLEIPFEIQRPHAAPRPYLLVDTAGLRRASQARGAVEKFSVMRAEGSIRHADLIALVLDAEEGPRKQDKKILALATDARKGLVIVVNKWDLAQDRVTQRAYSRELETVWPSLRHAPVVYTSAQSGYNVRRALQVLDEVASRLEQKLSTGLMNRVLQRAMARTQPPMVDGLRLKVYYAVQIRARPLVIRLYVNAPRRMLPAYRVYLERSLREQFSLEGVPLSLELRQREQQAGRKPRQGE